MVEYQQSPRLCAVARTVGGILYLKCLSLMLHHRQTRLSWFCAVIAARKPRTIELAQANRERGTRHEKKMAG